LNFIMEDEDLLARIKNLSTALNNLSESDSEDLREGSNNNKEGEKTENAKEEIAEDVANEEALEEVLQERIEAFFDLCDDDQDGYIFDDDAEIFRDRIRQHPKDDYRPLLEWIKSMPHKTIKNTSRAMFIEDVFFAFEKHYPDNPARSLADINALSKMLRDSIELEKKEGYQGGHTGSDAYSDNEGYDDSEHTSEIDIEPTSETSTKKDPGREVVTKEKVKKDPARTSIPEKGLDWKPHKKTFKAKKRKRKTPASTPAYAPPERAAGPREIGVTKGYRPYKPTPTKHQRSKTADLTSMYKGDPTAERKLGPVEIGRTKGWHRAKYDNVGVSLGSSDDIFEERFTKVNRAQSVPAHLRQRSLGPREIGISKGYRPAKYDWQKSVPGRQELIFPERVPKSNPVNVYDYDRKTGPREETYPEGWRPPPKEWENTLWRPDTFDINVSASAAAQSRKPRKIPIRRAKTVADVYSKTMTESPIRRDPVPKHTRSKTVNFDLARFSSEPVVIKRKKKEPVQAEAGEADPMPLKPRERATLEGVFGDDDFAMLDMASDPVEDGVENGEIDSTSI